MSDSTKDPLSSGGSGGGIFGEIATVAMKVYDSASQTLKADQSHPAVSVAGSAMTQNRDTVAATAASAAASAGQAVGLAVDGLSKIRRGDRIFQPLLHPLPQWVHPTAAIPASKGLPLCIAASVATYAAYSHIESELHAADNRGLAVSEAPFRPFFFLGSWGPEFHPVLDPDFSGPSQDFRPLLTRMLLSSSPTAPVTQQPAAPAAAAATPPPATGGAAPPAVSTAPPAAAAAASASTLSDFDVISNASHNNTNNNNTAPARPMVRPLDELGGTVAVANLAAAFSSTTSSPTTPPAATAAQAAAFPTQPAATPPPATAAAVEAVDADAASSSSMFTTLTHRLRAFYHALQPQQVFGDDAGQQQQRRTAYHFRSAVNYTASSLLAVFALQAAARPKTEKNESVVRCLKFASFFGSFGALAHSLAIAIAPAHFASIVVFDSSFALSHILAPAMPPVIKAAAVSHLFMLRKLFLVDSSPTATLPRHYLHSPTRWVLLFGGTARHLSHLIEASASPSSSSTSTCYQLQNAHTQQQPIDRAAILSKLVSLWLLNAHLSALWLPLHVDTNRQRHESVREQLVGLLTCASGWTPRGLALANLSWAALYSCNDLGSSHPRIATGISDTTVPLPLLILVAELAIWPSRVIAAWSRQHHHHQSPPPIRRHAVAQEDVEQEQQQQQNQNQN